ncbi:MAG: hypothetical protein OHK93_002567 [Ramalina farinacea]|uniref:DUF7924 domain-containing protein n=1 Tax=Ramalina farinacea TaxID=258253 RepID=A0AA43TXA5_9LECA|nr:hypothetical protein [Ramalina farinacea]
MERPTEKRKRSSSPEVRSKLVSISPTLKQHLSSDKQVQSSSKRLFSELPFEFSTPPRSPLPLTTSNLQLLDPTMSPAKSGTSKGKADTASTGSSDNHYAIALQILKANGHYSHEVIDPVKFPDVKAYVDSILRRKRKSVLAEDTVNFLMSEGFRTKLKSWNERTLIDHFWPEILHQSRESNIPRASLNPNDPAKIGEKRWRDDHLDWIGDEKFRNGSIPQLAWSETDLKVVYESLPKLKEPKPDHAYGFADAAFDQVEQGLNSRNLSVATLVNSALWHIFFISEWKSSRGDMAEAEIQALRSGSAVINAMQIFRDRADPLICHDHDYDLDISFSLTSNNDTSIVWANWPDTQPGKFHMGKYNTYYTSKGQDMIDLHHDIDNIMDWGCGTRLKTVKWLLGFMAQRDIELQQSAQA